MADIAGYETENVFETSHHQILIRRLWRGKSQNILMLLGKQGMAKLCFANICMEILNANTLDVNKLWQSNLLKIKE